MLRSEFQNTKTGQTRWGDLSTGLIERRESHLTWLKAEAVVQGREVEWLFPRRNGTLLDKRD